MIVNYKYLPEDFKGKMTLPADLAAFYNSYEAYIKNDKSEQSEFALLKASIELKLSIENRREEGLLTLDQESELDDYFSELLEFVWYNKDSFFS